ncbi:exodeoxyribonuclease VII small subunit [Halorientalis brevis]|uniref:Exodeoxyribonuclease VII small subunit n=1 Tax=Halorientalis brevis TaxID=1126241 RepID=A0ABD6CCZ4_9EURY|nr:exodeoxyribonuclease VII small subunit [Halorientalis brevis]
MATIDEKVARVEEIIDQLEAGEVSLGEAKQLRDEGKELLASLESDLDIGDAEILEQ